MVAHGVVEAGSRFLLHRLPEVYASVSSDRAHFPVQYLGANVPQAWAAGSVFSLLQALVGVTPDPATNALIIDPVLPEWLLELTPSNISVGPRSATLRLWREGDGSSGAEIGGDPGVRLMRRRYGERW